MGFLSSTPRNDARVMTSVVVVVGGRAVFRDGHLLHSDGAGGRNVIHPAEASVDDMRKLCSLSTPADSRGAARFVLPCG